MIVDAEGYGLVNAIESLLQDAEDGEIKPELMESVLEISTNPARRHRQAGEQLRRLRTQVRRTAAGARPDHRLGRAPIRSRCGRTSASSPAPRYRELVTALRFVARQELIFGMHVHVGVDDPDKAIHVANGMRVHLAVLLALSANSPFWRADATGLLSARTPIFRTFPRVGIPPHYRDWAALRAARSPSWSSPGSWRTTPGSGTTCARTRSSGRSRCGCATRRRASSTRSRWPRSSRRWSRSSASTTTRAASSADYPWQMLDENKWLAARHGLEGELVDLPSSERVATKALARRLLRPPARARPGPRLGRRARGDRRPAGPRQRRPAPARRLRGQPRPARGHGRDRRGDGAATAPRPARSAARAGGARRARSRPASAGSRRRWRRS